MMVVDCAGPRKHTHRCRCMCNLCKASSCSVQRRPPCTGCSTTLCHALLIPTQRAYLLCRRLLLTSTAGVFAALLLLAGMFWFSELASPAVIPGPNASGMCGAAPVDTCFACLQKVTCKRSCMCLARRCRRDAVLYLETLSGGQPECH